MILYNIVASRYCKTCLADLIYASDGLTRNRDNIEAANAILYLV
jgi:hypothetical protein